MKQLLYLDEFREAVAAPAISVIDYTASWCGPCRMIAPYVHALEERFPDVAFYSVDVDAAQAIATDQRVRSMPTFAFWRGGERLAEFSGANKQRLDELLARFAAPAPVTE